MLLNKSLLRVTSGNYGQLIPNTTQSRWFPSARLVSRNFFYRFGLSNEVLYFSDLCSRQKSIDSETFSLWVCAGAAFALLKNSKESQLTACLRIKEV